MKKKILTRSFLVFFIACAIVSCDKSQIFDTYYTFDNGWKNNKIVTFKFNQKASKEPKNLFINTRVNNDYEFSNLFLIVKLEEPDGLIKIDTLEYLMAHPDGNLQGNLLGTGFSNIKESKLWYKENKQFSKNGQYKVSIQQAVRKSGKVKGEALLKGITEIGFRIESIEKQ